MCFNKAVCILCKSHSGSQMNLCQKPLSSSRNGYWVTSGSCSHGSSATKLIQPYRAIIMIIPVSVLIATVWFYRTPDLFIIFIVVATFELYGPLHFTQTTLIIRNHRADSRNTCALILVFWGFKKIFFFNFLNTSSQSTNLLNIFSIVDPREK